MKKFKDIAALVGAGAVILGFSLWGIFGGKSDFSESERRVLAKFPDVNAETIFSGKFMTEFESYSLDHFPMRDTFRGMKSAAVLNVFQQAETNGLYVEKGYIAKAEKELSDEMISHSADHFQSIYDKFLKDTDAKVYFSIVPDKHYFLSEEMGSLALDYGKLVSEMRDRTDYMEYIDIFPLLSIEDYYKTDTHWRQECITDVAAAIGKAMGVEPKSDYVTLELDNPFYGVYYGQLALPLKPDKLYYLNSSILDECTVTSYNTGMPVEKSVYDMEKAASRDPYEIFLGGADPLIVIENPNAEREKELVVFRDSFGSSLVPLLVSEYSKVTLIDTRYMQSAAIGSFVKFDNQDVLFLYSTLILNNSLAMK